MSDSLLFVTQVAPYRDGPAGVHGVLEQATVGVAQVAELCGLEAARVDDVRAVDVDGLRKARALALFTIGETPWSAEQRTVVLEHVRAGALAVLAIHSATDSCYGWDEYGALVGARFDGHPWTQSFAADVLDREHPACTHLGDTWPWHDEVYQFRDLRPDARVLLRVPDEQLDFDAPGARPPSFGYPLAWCFEEGEGRAFSTSLGHFPAAWESPAYLRHLQGGLAWALGTAYATARYVAGMERGDIVDDFTLPDEAGTPRTLSALLENGPVVLFFYPAAMTMGCTKESCHFRDLASEFAAVGGQRVGISRDPVDKQRQFSEKHSFDYPLLSDADGTVARMMGVARTKGPPKRVTFVIDQDRKVVEVIKSEIRMGVHADKALDALRSLQH